MGNCCPGSMKKAERSEEAHLPFASIPPPYGPPPTSSAATEGGESSTASISAPLPVPNSSSASHASPDFKLLLLGAGDSGKSTFFRHLRIAFGEGYSLEERAAFKESIHAQIVIGFSKILLFLQQQKEGSLPNGAEVFLHMAERPEESLLLSPEDGRKLEALWKDDAVQKIWMQRLEWQTSESFDTLEYFLNDIERITSENYIPSIQDLLRVRTKTTGISKLKFSQLGASFNIVDVGGQRSERRKWQQAFTGVSALLFFAPLSEFDQILYEDGKTNRFSDSLVLFQNLCSSPYLREALIILILNKDDIFQEKVERGCSIAKSFPEYQGPESAAAITEYIRNKYMEKAEGRKIYVNVTTCTDMQKMKLVFESVRDLVFLKNQFVPPREPSLPSASPSAHPVPSTPIATI